MNKKHDNEPTEQNADAVGKEKAAPKNLAEFLEGYIGVVDSSKDPNAGTYRTSASKYGQQYSDLLWEEYQRDQAEAKLRYEEDAKHHQ